MKLPPRVATVRLAAWIIATICVAACAASCTRRGSARPVQSSAAGADTRDVPSAPDPCDPHTLRLGDAGAVVAWTVPAGCTLRDATPGRPPQPVRSETEFAAAFDCPAGTTSGIDFTASSLFVTPHFLSPASAGTNIVDDGTRVTFIQRQRAPCPNDPMPMPMTSPVPLAFLLPAHATRTFGQLACTITPSCR